MCAVIRAFPEMVLGVSSIGLDGEDLDTVSYLPKPKVVLPEGSLVVTAWECLNQSEAQLQVLTNLDIRTGLGDIVLARVTAPGNVLLGGPSTASGMQKASEALLRHGAQKILIDGAFARQSHAMVGDAIIYVVGAHHSPVMEKVVGSAGMALKRFALPEVDGSFGHLFTENRVGWLDKQLNFHTLPMATTLGQASQVLDAVPADAAWLYLPGALDSRLARSLVERRKEHSFGLILQSPLSLVVDDAELKHLFLLERNIRVLYPLNLAFIAINPVSPAGYAFDPDSFRDALGQITHLPLINAAEEE